MTSFIHGRFLSLIGTPAVYRFLLAKLTQTFLPEEYGSLAAQSELSYESFPLTLIIGNESIKRHPGGPPTFHTDPPLPILLSSDPISPCQETPVNCQFDQKVCLGFSVRGNGKTQTFWSTK